MDLSGAAPERFRLHSVTRTDDAHLRAASDKGGGGARGLDAAGRWIELHRSHLVGTGAVSGIAVDGA